jgi:tRNA U34 5-methylaminomethyl-2-thiouridine-forming methyltransferase MnmC
VDDPQKSDEPESPDPWSLVETEDGSPTLFHGGVGQACHSRAGAWREARETYAGGAQLRERALEGGLSRCRLLDVATGLGWNLAAALEALDGTGCTLEAVALESDARVLRRAVALARREPTVRVYPWWGLVADAVERALEQPDSALPVALGDGGSSLRLVLGDGRVTLERLIAREPELAFDTVFLDPFSPSADPSLWEWGFLDRIASCMAPGSLLVTYCAASRVRLGLALAGLRVGRGPGTGKKAEGTLASPDAAVPPLPARAAANLARALAEHGSGEPGA